MKIVIKENPQIVAESISQKIIEIVKEKPTSLICIAGGDTPLLTIEALIKANQAGEVDFSKTKFVGLDEWVGLGRETKGSCIQTLYDAFFDRLENVSSDQICFFDGQTADFEAECARVDAFIEACGGIDFILLGIGLNGHIGFNEPFVPVDVNCHVVELDNVTKRVMSKYFDTDLPLTHGISLGMQQILTAKEIYLVATGEKKAEIVQQVIEKEPTVSIPATLVKQAIATLVLDEAAASRWEK
ncbi:glucosamine-6-phosphate deaminase [Listeria seeligeri]|uniref:glucosamine-6-phosphate deaminase n=1 Tax=Listeria seeligeri TaxID=1640 RepID=UPI0010D9D626|nr:glucosamine-6-phosphate deaminase [Listeria seeligeri]MBC1481273.1 glucosamine-6-phosphate deaminase [Listeria seeligeri]MBC1539777.1 glucosamine-6-phosphate deaminase [Listeria seeligeri]MBC1557051.1 glucosamine-6-phosphate deaminase [Listeria seeligeri]MBC1721750.1 glucosamine-6-phosphate deaminase [Listeria seeligeri]MBC1731864.1 glucosamine-6-phosphate deaminase [Listeria seeligeri]